MLYVYIHILSLIEKRTKLQCLKKFSLQKGTIFSKSFAVLQNFWFCKQCLQKCGRRVCKLDVFLTLAKIGDTEIFAKMAYGTVTHMYDDLYILTYGVKGNCRIREVDPSSFLVNK